MRAVIYTRVSTKEQTKNLSLPVQEEECSNYCHGNGIEIDRVFREEGQSAKTEKRPVLQEMLKYCRANAQRIDCVVVYRLDRFARDQYAHFWIRHTLAALGITLLSVCDRIDDSPTGKFMEGVLSSVAQYENDVRAERTVTGMRAALEKGRWTFQPPLGYTAGPRGGGPSLLPDPDKAPQVLEAFRLVATGQHSQASVLAKITALGLRTRRGENLTPQALGSILKNPIYMGRMVVSKWDIDTAGDFEAIVPADLFDRAQHYLSKAGHPNTSHCRDHPDFPLRRFVSCAACQKPLTASWSKGRNNRYPYYRCPNSSCRHVNISKQRIEVQFLGLLRDMCLNPSYTALFREIVANVFESRHEIRARTLSQLHTRATSVEAKKQRLLESYLYDRVIDRKTFLKEKQRLESDLRSVRGQIALVKDRRMDLSGALPYACQLLEAPDRTWKGLENRLKRRFQDVLFPNGIDFDGKRFGTDGSGSVFTYLRPKNGKKESMASPRGFEPLLPP